LTEDDIKKSENELVKTVQSLSVLLEQHASSPLEDYQHPDPENPEVGIDFLRFIVNPNSFSQTVENMFYFSFLTRANVKLELPRVKSSWN
jgi:non-structural maintenance of chromosomes element 4